MPHCLAGVVVLCVANAALVVCSVNVDIIGVVVHVVYSVRGGD